MSDFELPLSARKPSRSSWKSTNEISTEPLASPSNIGQRNEGLVTPPTEGAEESDTAKTKVPSKYSPEELLQIFDEIIFSGEYRETVVIKNRLRVGFRTRTAEEINEIQRTVDSSGLNLLSSAETLRTFEHLVSSLVQYQDKDLEKMKEPERRAFIKKIPGPIMGALVSSLGAFDMKVSEACKDGEENF